MAQSSKILTVSYGTFSCTLEGFDNPFAAMQSIAEYFRDLAAEDRYFGAEPPQPDARMLHQIAEGEVRRRVEARVGESGVVLRQMGAEDEAGGDPAAPDAPPPREPAAPDAPPDEAPGSETVADRLARIRVTAAKRRDRTYENTETPGQDDVPAEAAIEDQSEHPLTAADTLVEWDVPPPDENPAPLSQISAARQVGDAEGMATIATGLATGSAHRAEDGPSLPEPAEGDAMPARQEPDGAQTDLAAVSEPQPSQSATRQGEVDLTGLIAAIASAERASGGPEDAPVPGSVAEQSAHETSEDWIEVEVEDDDGTLRVVRMTSAEFEAALANGDLEEIEDEAEAPTVDAEDTIRAILAKTSLTDADAAALAAELAALDQGLGAEDSGAAQDRDGGDKTVSRLLDETNVQMGEPEGHRRRIAIQHLRAAVAATRADRALRDRSPVQGASMEKFRDDLQKAVRHSHPETAGQSRRPTYLFTGAGPLVLVSSQRVDRRGEPARPVRSRKAAPAVDAPAENETFSDFAAKLGARDLPDLLEAAAAYSEVVEGQEGALRPVLIRRAMAEASAGTATREEGLKSFGQLLRAGRIHKIDAGRFALAADAKMAKRARAVP